jgi:hypothetical protein
VVQYDQTSILATSMMLLREDVRRPLQAPVSFFLTNEVCMSTILIVLLVVFLLSGGAGDILVGAASSTIGTQDYTT